MSLNLRLDRGHAVSSRSPNAHFAVAELCGETELLTSSNLHYPAHAARRGEEVCMRRGILPFLVLCLGMAGVASADPVTLTAGTLSVYGLHSTDFGFGSFDFSGGGFAAAGSGAGAAPAGLADGFTAGIVNPSGVFGVTAGDALNTGDITVGGQTFRGFASATFRVTA